MQKDLNKTAVTVTDHSDDAIHLEKLGYKSEFNRDMSLWANFSLGFTYLSPVVGIYTTFAYSLAMGGPPMIWSLFIAGFGQLLVALVFSEIVAQYPVAGGVYPWARRLWGRKWAWMTGWVYMIALLVTIASVVYGAGPYMAQFLGFEPTVNSTIICALIVLAIATIVNFLGTKVLAAAAVIGFTAASFVCLALVLAVADIPAVIAGENTTPVETVLYQAFGSVGSKIILGIVLLSFVSCAISLQAAASRLAYSYGRDDMIIGSSILKKFSSTKHVPPYSLLLAAIVPAIIVIGSKISTDATAKIVSFASFGIYLGFQMVVLAALRARLKGWKPSGKYQLGKWGLPINIGALVYGVTAMINIAWPRTPNAPWYDNYIVLLSAAIVVGTGLIYMAIHRSYGNSDVPYNDAIPKKDISYQNQNNSISS